MYHYTWVQSLEPLVHALEGMGLAHHDATAVLNSWAVCFFLLALGFLGNRGLATARARGGTLQFVPDATLSVRGVFEIYTEGIYNLASGVLSHKDSRRFFWLIGGLFIYILCGNLIAVLPGGAPPTDNVASNFAMAATVFIVFNVAGIASQGMGYFKHMAGPILLLAPLMFPIELIGVLVRPVSLSLRLAGNMTGDHMVFGIMTDLMPVVAPSIFLGMGMFVSFLQAFVFTLLTAIYISLSVAHGDEH